MKNLDGSETWLPYQELIAPNSADFAVISGGGICTSLAQGDISWRDLLQVQPFGNQVVSVTLTGNELLDYLAKVANIKPDSGGYAQFSRISLVADGSSVSEVKINGKPLQKDKTYRMATNSFNASGGDGYPVVNTHAGFSNTGLRDAEVLRDYVSQHSPLNIVDYVPQGIVHLTAAQVQERDKAQQKEKKRSYPQMILAWIWPLTAHQ